MKAKFIKLMNNMKIVNLAKPEQFFLLVIVVVGSLNSLLTPIGAGFDEETHVARIWEISEFSFIPNQKYGRGAYYPYIFYKMSYRQNYIVEPLEKGYLQSKLGERIGTESMEKKTRSVYFPTLYLLQGFIMGVLGRVLEVPFVIIYFVLRFSYLLSYAIMAFYAIKLIPTNKWLLTLLSLSPMSIIQASTVSPDSITYGGSFLLTAFLLNLAETKTKQIRSKDIALILLLTGLFFTLKLNSSVLILLVFLIKPDRFASRRSYSYVISGIVLLFLIVSVGWNFLILPKLSATGNEQSTIQQQMIFIMMHPLTYLKTICVNFVDKSFQYFKEWIGVFGYGYWSMPEWIYLLFSILIGFALISGYPQRFAKKSERILLLLTSASGYLFTVTLLYLKDNSVGAEYIGGVQGRYFIPFALPLLLAFTKDIPIINKKSFQRLFMLGIVLLMIVFLTSGYLSYHVTCGTSYYNYGYCYQPVYKNWAPELKSSDEITTEITLKQSFNPTCKNMEVVQLWMHRPDNFSKTTTIIAIIETQSDEVILKKTVDNNSLPESDWLTVEFPTIRDSDNREFELLIYSYDAESGNGATTGVSIRDEYGDGQLYINDVAVEYDILIRYGCSVGIGK